MDAMQVMHPNSRPTAGMLVRRARAESLGIACVMLAPELNTVMIGPQTTGVASFARTIALHVALKLGATYVMVIFGSRKPPEACAKQLKFQCKLSLQHQI